MKKIIVSLALMAGLAFAGTVLATQQICPQVPPNEWVSTQQIEAEALKLGYEKVFFVQPDGGCWVAFAEKEGVHYEVFFHPATLEVVRTERGS